MEKSDGHATTLRIIDTTCLGINWGGFGGQAVPDRSSLEGWEGP